MVSGLAAVDGTLASVPVKPDSERRARQRPRLGQALDRDRLVDDMADGDKVERQFPVSRRAPTTSFTPMSTNPARGSDLAWQSLGDVLRHLSEGVSGIRHLMSSDFAHFSQAAPTAEAMNRVGRFLQVGRPAWSTRDQRASARLGRRDDEHYAMTRADLLEDDIDLTTSGGKLLAHT